MRKKIIFLFLALVLPGLIFVFLKKFGKNEFAIPIYYQNNVDSVNSVCGTTFAQPYRIPDSVLRKAGWRQGLATLFVTDTLTTRGAEFDRLKEEFGTSSLQLLTVAPTKIGLATFERWSRCVLMIRNSANVVLVDDEKRIRGYYSIGSREEGDRLIMELQILLKKY